jgi:plastocyanin
MARRIRALILSGSFLLVALVVAPSVAAGDPCYHGYTIPPTTSAATSTVQLDPCAFLPTSARVAPGTTVAFVNRSGEEHLITGANAAWGDRDKPLAPGATVTVRFDEPGVYPYTCALHRGMTGAVVVGDPGADAVAAAATTSSTGQPPGDMSPQAGLAMLALAGLALAGWTVALTQRRGQRRPSLSEA